MSTERGQGELVEVLARATHILRMTAATDNPARDLSDAQIAGLSEYLAVIVQAHVDAEVAAALEGAADMLDRRAQGGTALNFAATLVRELIPTSGADA